jgi:radical SAM superfamily enzyme YgiQ (UPF0313 family)
MSMPPLGPLYIANQLRERGYEVNFLDRNAYLYKTLACCGQPTPQLLNALDAWTCQEITRKRPDIIGITMMTCQMRDARYFANLGRKVTGQDAIFVVGGYHPTCEPVEALEDIPELDIAVKGRGDQALADIAAGQNWQDVLGIAYRRRSRKTFSSRIRDLLKPASSGSKNDELFQTPDQPFEKDQVLAGRPARDLIDDSYYSKPGNTTISCYYFRKPASIITSIGCPYRCSFCASIKMEPKMYWRSIEEVIEEVESLIEMNHVSGLFFYDINFLAWKDRAEKLIRTFIERGINDQIKWLACTSARKLPYELLPELRKAGCIGLVFGFESNSQKILDILNKWSTPELNQKAVDACKANDIRPQSGFIVGAPGEKEEDLYDTFEFIQKNNLLSSLNVLLPLPGTEINQRLISSGKLDPHHPDYWGLIADTNAPLLPERVFSDIPFERFVELYNYGIEKICAPTWKTLYVDLPKEVDENTNKVSDSVSQGPMSHTLALSEL